MDQISFDDLIREHELSKLPGRIAFIDECGNFGFDFDSEGVSKYYCFSNQTQYSGHFIPILHEYLLIIKKDASLVYPILMTEPVQKDIRDMNGATWRDVVAAVLETCQSPVSLAYIYEQVEPYTKARKNQWWKEKVRQTLQCSPQLFVNTGRGMWALNRSA